MSFTLDALRLELVALGVELCHHLLTALGLLLAHGGDAGRDVGAIGSGLSLSHLLLFAHLCLHHHLLVLHHLHLLLPHSLHALELSLLRGIER